MRPDKLRPHEPVPLLDFKAQYAPLRDEITVVEAIAEFVNATETASRRGLAHV